MKKKAKEATGITSNNIEQKPRQQAVQAGSQSTPATQHSTDSAADERVTLPVQEASRANAHNLAKSLATSAPSDSVTLPAEQRISTSDKDTSQKSEMQPLAQTSQTRRETFSSIDDDAKSGVDEEPCTAQVIDPKKLQRTWFPTFASKLLEAANKHTESTSERTDGTAEQDAVPCDNDVVIAAPVDKESLSECTEQDAIACDDVVKEESIVEDHDVLKSSEEDLWNSDTQDVIEDATSDESGSEKINEKELSVSNKGEVIDESVNAGSDSERTVESGAIETKQSEEASEARGADSSVPKDQEDATQMGLILPDMDRQSPKEDDAESEGSWSTLSDDSPRLLSKKEKVDKMLATVMISAIADTDEMKSVRFLGIMDKYADVYAKESSRQDWLKPAVPDADEDSTDGVKVVEDGTKIVEDGANIVEDDTKIVEDGAKKVEDGDDASAEASQAGVADAATPVTKANRIKCAAVFSDVNEDAIQDVANCKTSATNLQDGLVEQTVTDSTHEDAETESAEDTDKKSEADSQVVEYDGSRQKGERSEGLVDAQESASGTCEDTLKDKTHRNEENLDNAALLTTFVTIHTEEPAESALDDVSTEKNQDHLEKMANEESRSDATLSGKALAVDPKHAETIDNKTHLRQLEQVHEEPIVQSKAISLDPFENFFHVDTVSVAMNTDVVKVVHKGVVTSKVARQSRVTNTVSVPTVSRGVGTFEEYEETYRVKNEELVRSAEILESGLTLILE